MFIVDRAALPGCALGAQRAARALISLMLGLGAGAGLALFLEQLDDRVRAPEEVEQLSGLTVLGIIPRIDTEEGLSEGLC